MSKRKFKPPEWIDSLLFSLLNPTLYEAVMGDLDEKFLNRITSNRSIWYCKLMYILEALGFIRLARKRTYHNPIAMYQNYFLIALRILFKDKLYLILNISGLAIGITCLLLVHTYVQFEKSFDSFHVNKEQIYRVPEEYIDDEQLVSSAMNHAPMAPLLAQNLAGVKNVIRIFPYSRFFNAFISTTPENITKENNFIFADSTFFQTFSFESLSGSLDKALSTPFQVVLTRKMAEKYFGSIDVLGKPITFRKDENSYTYFVSGVIENIPQNSHFNFDFIASFVTCDQFMPWYNNWHHPSMFIYLEMLKPIDPSALSEKIQTIARAHQPSYILEESRKYNAQLLTDIHLHSNLENEWQTNSDYSYLKIYLITGLFVLLIACINFMNLTSARSFRRAKEVGMRKIFGGKKGQLINQFLMESLLYCLLSFLLAIVITEISFQYVFNGIIDKDISLFKTMDWKWLLQAITFILFFSIISGIYPAVFLSSFKPIRILKGTLTSTAGSVVLRKVLVTFQFFISCLLITITLIIVRQVAYINTKTLGFDKDHILSIKLSDRFSQQNYQQFKNTLLTKSGVSKVALSSTLPGRGDFHVLDIQPEGEERKIGLKTLGVDEDFLSTYNLTLLEGRNFSKNIVSDDKQAFIINESAASRLGWKNPVGKEISLSVHLDGLEVRKGIVIGMVKDFNFQSLHSQIEPLVIYINKHPYYADYLSAKLNTPDIRKSVELLTGEWKKFNPEKPIELYFLDDELAKLYKYENKVSKIFNLLAFISIFISCLGLFGLSSFMAEKRIKEFGIRKVMGAGLLQILKLQSREFIILIIIANILVWPIAWWWGTNWLNGFAFHITLNPVFFVLPLVITFILVLLTLLYHTFKTVKANPIHSFRYE